MNMHQQQQSSIDIASIGYTKLKNLNIYILKSNKKYSKNFLLKTYKNIFYKKKINLFNIPKKNNILK